MQELKVEVLLDCETTAGVLPATPYSGLLRPKRRL